MVSVTRYGESCSTTTVSTAALSRYIPHENVSHEMEEEFELAECSDVSALDSSIGMELDSSLTRKRRLVEEASKSSGTVAKYGRAPDWDTDKFFDNSWSDFLASNIPDSFDVAWLTRNPKWKKWLQVIPNHGDVDATRFKCRICAEYYDKFGLVPQSKPALASEQGVTLRKGAKIKNYEFFKEHVEGKRSSKGKNICPRSGKSVHQTILERLKGDERSRFRLELPEIQMEIGGQNLIYKVTADMMRTVYAEVKINIPFYSHPKFVELQRMNGIDLGRHHHDNNAAKRMCVFISDEMHKELINHLKTVDSPFSLIVDTSTDYAGNHFLIVLIRAFEFDKNAENEITAERPVVYFYRLIEMGHSEDAQTMLNLIDTALEDDNKFGGRFRDKFKKKLVGFASDGASVMQGKYGGLAKKLEDYSGRSIYSIHCMAHRLQLATGHAWENAPIFNEAERLIDGIYNFYNNKGHKRKAHLKETAAALERVYYQFSGIFKVRWIASEFSECYKIFQSL